MLPALFASETSNEAQLPGELGFASLVTGLAVLAGMAAEQWLDVGDLSLAFITAVIIVAARTRTSVAVYAALLCFLAYNFFFIHPRYTFYIAAPRGVATVASFLIAALVCGRLASRLRAQVLLLGAANARASALQAFAQKLTSAANEDEALRAATDALREALDAEVLLIPLDEGSGKPRADAPQFEASRHDPALQRSLSRFLQKAHGDAAGAAPELADLSWHCLPVQLHARLLAVACLRFPLPLPQIPAVQAQLVQAMLRDLAQALARARLVHQVEQVRVLGESERLRAALLSSVSHDLRSPLSTIIGSAESLLAYRDKLSAADQIALAQDIHGEGQRLDRYIQNLLDMTRVGQGALSIAREWVALDEVCGALLARLRRAHPDIQVHLELPRPAPWLHAHPALLEQALYNVLDNAAKFSPPNRAIVLRIERHAPWLQIDVLDRGPGIAEADREHVFDRFYTGDGDRRGVGTGLGLTICQGIVLAHGGQVQALPGQDGIGTLIRLRFPLAAQPGEPAKDD